MFTSAPTGDPVRSRMDVLPLSPKLRQVRATVPSVCIAMRSTDTAAAGLSHRRKGVPRSCTRPALEAMRGTSVEASEK